MKNRLALYVLTSVLGTSSLLAACSDDSDDPDAGGGGGETSAAGQNVGGSSAGKSQGGSAGKAQGGKTGASGSSATGGAGGDASSSGGASGGGADSGEPDAGGAGGAGGSGGEGAEPLAYVCGTTSINHELCSALSAADCSEPVDCSDCVMSRSTEREPFTECAACLAEYDAFLQCGIDAYESGNISAGIECYDGFADLNDACAEHFNSAASCTSYLLEHDCPSSWPVD
jgi:hypothetical protein